MKDEDRMSTNDAVCPQDGLKSAHHISTPVNNPVIVPV
jgi:hypothetical protein